jgi:hypothetical protein
MDQTIDVTSETDNFDTMTTGIFETLRVGEDPSSFRDADENAIWSLNESIIFVFRLWAINRIQMFCFSCLYQIV